ncbi:hypothetical protein BATDEDRAFT_88978 [Batrachochytrium dendrobatidis JAM81]|uniref:Uncharacterized protein n=1 Tax=Batrachochytrium dendrobatidis (strain JAM81 / FGSC 10211) TaxID=684364 RepID=F4P2X8_BATDJ|nr:uncharacterized protein BATDEDRAFT_88978 [Batrachochytrium dendrobatidis JAM81]EGF80260.1 hypothetical protein BATDEDRAFT_88978 [Batrachochytrium dendrobatidis JAM81]|eukprot:XP_006679224.1 hypothetical protein BATDEDRAFT_88978 [Batrachochytrium dendrobatidis JAM81]
MNGGSIHHPVNINRKEAKESPIGQRCLYFCDWQLRRSKHIVHIASVAELGPFPVTFDFAEAKKEWLDSAVPQVLAKAGCLLKKRLAAGKETPVLAVLTNGTLFRFFAIDIDGVVYASTIYLLKLDNDRTYKTSTSLSEILRWFTWFMTAIKSVSPRASSEDLTDTMTTDSLTRLRSCFEPKVPIQNKKAKIEK